MIQSVTKFLSRNLLEVVFISIGVFGRLMPHVPNITPLTSLSLITSVNLSRRKALLVLFITLFISDIGLALLFDFPAFGYWTLFTYTGFAAITLVSSKLQRSWKTLPIYIFNSSFYFWIWTNFGVWLTSNLYSKTLAGLCSCYIVALPFLRNSLIGDMVYGLVIFGIYDLIKTRIQPASYECTFKVFRVAK
jgi:hypothetical protein